NEEPLKYKIIYNITALILIVPMFMLKGDIKSNGNISIIFIGIVAISIFFIISLVIKLNKNNIDKKIICKSII
ncbi:MAG: hypothetical protein ACRDDM_12370, partial [Paraclostridium sp.]